MCPSSRHIAFANRSQTTLSYLAQNPQDHAEWITVVAFYKALHVVEAVFEHQGLEHGKNHESREALLKKHNRFEEIFRNYRALWAASTVARYLATPAGDEFKSFAKYLAADRVVGKMVDHYLHRIEQSAIGFLGDECGLVRCS
ncbi:MAG: hypothetical protein JW818_10275 [Pirellulales bacterium]|nr:hypothetical protein [Pirellulales bacterium]